MTYAASDSACVKGSTWPSLRRQEGITEHAYDPVRDGRIWCVTVQHPDHLIIAQRAEAFHGQVTKQSRPVVVGQCMFIMDIPPARASAVNVMGAGMGGAGGGGGGGQVGAAGGGGSSKEALAARKKRKDPNAPKRASNAYMVSIASSTRRALPYLPAHCTAFLTVFLSLTVVSPPTLC